MVTGYMTQKLVSVLTFHKRVAKFVHNLVKHIPIMIQISYK